MDKHWYQRLNGMVDGVGFHRGWLIADPDHEDLTLPLTFSVGGLSVTFSLKCADRDGVRGHTTCQKPLGDPAQIELLEFEQCHLR